jgi:transposase
MAECDQEIEAALKKMAATKQELDPETPPEDKEGKRASKNAPKIVDFHRLMLRILGGNNPGRIPGLTDYTVLQLVSEIGTDLSAFPTEKHFTSWLGLAPGNRNSGKRKRNQSRKGGRAGQIFRAIARTVGNGTKMGLGVFYRRIRSTRGGLVASKALGRKLAEVYYRVMKKGLKFVEEGLAQAEKKYEAQAKQRLERLAKKMGYTLTENSAIAAQGLAN